MYRRDLGSRLLLSLGPLHFFVYVIFFFFFFCSAQWKSWRGKCISHSAGRKYLWVLHLCAVSASRSRRRLTVNWGSVPWLPFLPLFPSSLSLRSSSSMCVDNFPFSKWAGYVFPLWFDLFLFVFCTFTHTDTHTQTDTIVIVFGQLCVYFNLNLF